jgi:hypothetical protein
MEAQSSLPSEGGAEAPEVGHVVLLHVPGRSDPVDAIVTGVSRNEARPHSLNVRIDVPGVGPTNLVWIEHVSQEHPFGGWELRQ